MGEDLVRSRWGWPKIANDYALNAKIGGVEVKYEENSCPIPWKRG